MSVEHYENKDATQPFPSWTWKVIILEDGTELGGYWDAPVPTPTVNGKVFRWDESTTSWIEV